MDNPNRYRPFDGDATLSSCSCGQHASESEHDAQLRNRSLSDAEFISRDVVEAAAVRALFPRDDTRRSFIRAVGKSAAMAAVYTVLPIASLQEAFAQDKSGNLEKRDLDVGFVPITCATPLIAAEPLGFYKEQGLNVTLQKVGGWALVRDRMLNRELDASHTLAPMPLAISMGVGSQPTPTRVATIQNVNGQAIVLALKHKDNRDPRNWKGFKFAIPFDFSMHNFLLRYYLAEHGIDPDRDVQLRVTPPAEMIANLRAGNIDGFLGPDPFNQRAVFDEVGFIHILSKDIWAGHPCCSFSASEAFVKQNPNTFAALYRATLKGAAYAHEASNRPALAKMISAPAYLNQPELVVRQVLTGTFADGLGQVQRVSDRVDFEPLPWYSMAVWMMTQMKRWGYVKGDVDYHALAEKVFLLTDARAAMKQIGATVPDIASTGGYRPIAVMGRTFDPAHPDGYVRAFAIKRA
ncbi:CmpA/NrtA family ABC transporter substrate-binding protein [Paraburkholderia sp. BL9I2N2]|uniref:CmpA/NrtA family ABC transporter substrate-binding protein n=1 Tax=Paraburkholderia sp. BL9I2N2 TaxID=1938809 RepID=UPI00104D048E|nr:CmpA/NrtA family ABC transporter substrate-binding protein [Paraburkholderia sp. BL9I2N2]TCK84355.1 nitrate/nitrite transport system substrate-binding protein [Paraburkholderia sp. BL9I2N2]